MIINQFNEIPTLYCKSPAFSEAYTPYSDSIEFTKLNQYDRVLKNFIKIIQIFSNH